MVSSRINYALVQYRVLEVMYIHKYSPRLFNIMNWGILLSRPWHCRSFRPSFGIEILPSFSWHCRSPSIRLLALGIIPSFSWHWKISMDLLALEILFHLPTYKIFPFVPSFLGIGDPSFLLALQILPPMPWQ